jgi:hypothetical protein
MRKLLIVALVAAQLAPVAAPARAAELRVEPQRQETRMGAFAGARLRVALGGERRERVRAGLAVAPELHRMEAGAARMRIGEGLEYGFTDRRPAAVSVAGRRLSDAQRAPDGRRQGVSTLGWVAIGAGVVLVIGVGVLGWLVHEANENTE